jgi:hypothetical protein
MQVTHVVHLLDAASAHFAVMCPVRSAVSTLVAKPCFSRLSWTGTVRARDKAGVLLHRPIQAVQEQAATNTHPTILTSEIAQLRTAAPHKIAKGACKPSYSPVQCLVKGCPKCRQQPVHSPYRRKHESPVHKKSPDTEHDDEAHEASSNRVVTKLPEGCDEEALKCIGRARTARAGHLLIAPQTRNCLVESVQASTAASIQVGFLYLALCCTHLLPWLISGPRGTALGAAEAQATSD